MVQITEIQVTRTERNARLSARVQHLGTGPENAEIWLCYPPEYYEHLSRSADPWIAMFLWPAMKLGQDLHVEAPASSLLLRSTRTLMDIMHCWNASFRPVAVTSCGTAQDRAGGSAVAGFFSGGVDSFYTALKHTSAQTSAESRITHLISVKGLDVKVGDDALWTRVTDHLRESAAELGCSWTECATNVREVVTDGLIPWSMYYGGARRRWPWGSRDYGTR